MAKQEEAAAARREKEEVGAVNATRKAGVLLLAGEGGR